MKCLKCGMEVKENSTICPFCGSSITKPINKFNDDEFVELPILKTENKAPEFEEKDNDMLNSLAEKFDKDDVSLEKTRTIKPVEDQNEFSLLEDINKQIETVNDEAKEEVEVLEPVQTPESVPSSNNTLEVKPEKKGLISLESKESVSKRTKVLVITAAIVLVLVLVVGIGISSVLGSKKNANSDLDNRLNGALQTYYTSGKTEDISKILEDVKDDKDVLDEVHNKIKDKSNEWLNEYYETEYVSQAEFNSETTRYKDLFRGLFEYAIYRDGSDYIRALDSSDYDALVRDIDDNYNDSRIFYESIDLYNNKDYNKAYYALNQIPSNSVIYNKTRIYVDRINSNVLGLLKTDISNIEQDITNLNDSDILKMYTQIEQVILDYDRVYSNLDLTQNKEYSDLLNTYQAKVNQYSNQ